MSRILLCNNTLSHYAGSELLTLELARELSKSGHHVSVATFASAGEIKQEFDQLGIHWLDLSAPPGNHLAQHFDLLWGHHVTCFDSLLLDRKITATAIIFSSLSPHLPIDCPPLYLGAYCAFLANSLETRDALSSYGIEAERIAVLPSCVSSQWLGKIRHNHSEKLQSLAVVSNHVPGVIKGAISLLREQGVKVSIYGINHEYRKVTPEILSQYDAVVSIGRTVQAAMALGLPVYCYDRFGGPGYISQENFTSAAYFNFSGRCSKRQCDAMQISTELMQGYAAACRDSQTLAALIERDFHLERWVDQILKQHLVAEAESLPPSPVLEQARRLRQVNTYRPPMISPLQQWLNAREENSTQAKALKKRATSTTSSKFGIIVRDRLGDTDALKKTLQSLHATARDSAHLSIYIISPLPKSKIENWSENNKIQWLRDGWQTQGSYLSIVNSLIADASFDWFVLIEAGERFITRGLLRVVAELSEPNTLHAVFADEMLQAEDGELSALLRPDFNLDLLLSMPSSHANHWFFKQETCQTMGGLDPQSGQAAELDLLLKLAEKTGLSGFGHIHEPLLLTPARPMCNSDDEIQAISRHLQRRGYDQAWVAPTLPGGYRLHYAHPDTPGVSIIIPTRNQFGMLRRCVESLLEKTSYKNYEILIVDNGSDEADACSWLNGIEAMGSAQLRVLRYPQPFNYSAMNNLAARHARGDYLVLLNNDTAIVRGDWLDALLNHAQRPEVGVVGAKLLYPDSRIQHAGVVLGLRGPAEHPFAGAKLDSPGYMYRTQLDQDYSAVTGACLMIRRSLYEQVGGLDEEHFKVSYNDVDLCLKVRQSGHLVVWTPHAVLLHEGSVSQKSIDNDKHKAKLARFRGEQDAMLDKWLPAIADDPAYNRNLSLHGSGFTIETDPLKNWRPLPWRPLPVILTLPADDHGCGHYRIKQPAAAMNEFGMAEVVVSGRYPDPIQMQRYAPDSAVLQRQFDPDKIGLQKRLNRFNNCLKVAELDDYLPNLPLKSAANGLLPRDILKHMRKALRQSDRFIVSTPALAEALHGLHPDIRIVENHLPLPWWQHQKGLRRQGSKPRVGWGGGNSHRGDLELIADVVQALAGEVEWVFLGMCPERLRPYLHEYHGGVPIEDYPAKLAGLNLDLALAPLEDNTFNQCKSNLRLLEYGACGFPVVCSEVRPYQGDLPVTRVKPRFKDWVEAIRMHIHDLDAAAAAGDALRQAIHRDWMLDEKHARFWLSQWLPD